MISPIFTKNCSVCCHQNNSAHSLLLLKTIWRHYLTRRSPFSGTAALNFHRRSNTNRRKSPTVNIIRLLGNINRVEPNNRFSLASAGRNHVISRTMSSSGDQSKSSGATSATADRKGGGGAEASAPTGGDSQSEATAAAGGGQYVVSKELDDCLNYLDSKRATPKNSAKKFPLVAPATGELLIDCSSSGKDDVDEAVRSAKKAFDSWSKLSGLERGHILRKAADLIKANVKDLACWEVIHNGKPIYEAEADILYSADTLIFYAGIAPTIHGEHIPMSGGMNFAYTRREPLGVCAGIGAWNYPFQTCSWKCAPALACGNTFVYKPSPWAPITPVLLAEILTHAGLPSGVFNIVQGEKETGEALISHPDVAKVSFTGSVITGQRIMELCAQRGLKRVTLELGGKSPLIIFDDCNLENAVKGAMMANFLTQGEVCSNATRVFVHKNIFNDFLAKLVERTKKLSIGDPLKPTTTVGAVITKEHLNKVLTFVETAKKEGAKIECGGERVKLKDDPRCKGGFFFSPCVMSNVNDSMQIVREEVFGPVLTVLPFESEDEVIKRANNTPYGLSAGVFTNNLSRAHRVVAQLQAGYIWINNYNVQPVEIPFGGYKMSGFGRELGSAAVENYTQLKSVYVELGNVETMF